MGIKKLFYIFKPIISLLPNSLCSRLVPEVEKKGPKNYTSSLAIGTMCRSLKWVSKYDFIVGNKEFFFSKIPFIRG
jgi:hypothetical protein